MNDLTPDEYRELLFLVTYADLGKRKRDMSLRKIKVKLQNQLAILENRKEPNIGVLKRVCPVCSTPFDTLEQRRIYCSGACKTKSCRSKTEVSK